MSKQKKFYVVWEGYHPGVYERWDDCKKEIDGFAKAKYKSFETLLAAHTAFRDGYALHIKQGTSPVEKTQEILQKLALLGKPLRSALAVDAACSGNPGSMEYRGVYVATGEQLFHIGPLEQGTNNVGEFLALVHGLALCKKQNSPVPIYSDSRIALGWIKDKKCKTTLLPTPKNKAIFNLIERAETWLLNNSYTTELHKWETEAWGEIPADFGRK